MDTMNKLRVTVAMLVGQTFLYVSNFLWQNYIIFNHDEQDQ